MNYELPNGPQGPDGQGLIEAITRLQKGFTQAFEAMNRLLSKHFANSANELVRMRRQFGVLFEGIEENQNQNQLRTDQGIAAGLVLGEEIAGVQKIQGDTLEAVHYQGLIHSDQLHQVISELQAINQKLDSDHYIRIPDEQSNFTEEPEDEEL